MAIKLTSFGDLIKVDNGDGTIQYFDRIHILNMFKILPNSNIVSTINNKWPFQIPLNNISIGGITPTTTSEFQTQLEKLTSSVFHKFDPLLAIGYLPTAITAPVRRVTALGNNPDVDQGTVPETIWPGGGLYPWMTGATSLEVISTSVEDSPTGTGMGAISLTLMNTSYAESSVAVTLNGTTAVAIMGTWFRINGGITTTKGSGAAVNNVSNAGDIIIRDAGGGTTRAIIQAGKGIMRNALYTVPAGYSLQIVSQYIGFNRGTGGGATRYLTAVGFIQNSAGVARRPLDLSCNGESYRHDGIPGIMIPEKTDFAMEVISVSADNSDVTGAFLGVLTRNDIISTLAYP